MKNIHKRSNNFQNLHLLEGCFTSLLAQTGSWVWLYDCHRYICKYIFACIYQYIYIYVYII